MWQATSMVKSNPPALIARAQVEALTIEAMVLADEAETYFAGAEDAIGDDLSPELKVAFACEAFRTAQRLKALVGWLALDHDQGHGDRNGHAATWRTEAAPACDLKQLPPRARAIVAATHELCQRVAQLQRPPRLDASIASPARLLQERLQASIGG